MQRLKTYICLVLIALITIAPALSLATPNCCSNNTLNEAKKTSSSIKCHEGAQITKNEVKIKKSEKCQCDCGNCKVSSCNINNVAKIIQKYQTKYLNLNPQAFIKAPCLGIFNPPKFIS